MQDIICPKKFRTSEYIAKGAEIILKFVGCGNIPSYDEILKIAMDNEGLNPPVHKDHLGEEFNIGTFTGIRPPSMPIFMFEDMYLHGVPWTGLIKKNVIVENYSQTKTFIGENFGKPKAGAGRKTRKKHLTRSKQKQSRARR